MYLKYGNYSHASGETAIVIAKEAIFNESGVKTDIVETWSINGMLFAASTTLLTAALRALAAAYSVNGRDLGLYEDAGAATVHTMLSRNCRGGTKVRSFSYPKGSGYQYGTYRDYAIVVEGIQPAVTGLLQFDESISWTGGGPQFAFQECLTGLPRKQLLKQATTYKARQSGEAVGSDGYPSPPGPIWPGAEHIHLREVSFLPPRRTGDYGSAKHTEYRIQWSYLFESATPLIGNPRKLL